VVLCTAMRSDAVLGRARICLSISAGQSTVWPCDVVFGIAMRSDALRGKDCFVDLGLHLAVLCGAKSGSAGSGSARQSDD